MEYTREMKAALDYIEHHLNEHIKSEDAADAAGFSRYHFQRIFKKETGLGIYEYIQRRRLSKAASLLLYTDMPVIDIALYFCFDSQEAFTRAFKRIYGIPPGRYRRALSQVINNEINGGNDMNEPKNKNAEIPHWFVTGTAPDKYQAGIDQRIFHSGTRSAVLRSTSEDYDTGEYGTIMQQFSAREYSGKRLRFSGFVKAESVTGWAGLWMRLDSGLGETLKLDNMQNRPITGTAEWNLYSCVLDVPAEAAVINFGILLSGKGTVWLDNVAFQEVDDSVPTTDFDLKNEYPDQPMNLSFEE